MLIYQLIEQAGDRGIWTRDLKYKSNLQSTQITKILKALESRKLVKCVPLAQAKNKKIYMLFNLVPHPEVSGDTWINSAAGEIDGEFIMVLNQQAFKYIQQKVKNIFEKKLRIRDLLRQRK
jgi:DNA-directed RNA polymerase III subunit RPC6